MSDLCFGARERFPFLVLAELAVEGFGLECLTEPCAISDYF